MVSLNKKSCAVLFLTILLSSIAFAQNNVLIFNEDFETGTNPFIKDSSFGLPQGINTWVKNNEYNGNSIYPNTTNQNNTLSGAIGNPNGYYLHISDSTQLNNVSNANYDPNSTSDHFVALNRSFCTLGFDSIEFSFFYICEGSPNAYAELYYSIDGGNWMSAGNIYNNQSLWKNERVMHPDFNNVFDLRFGFRWQNTSTTTANSISFGVDDIFLVGSFNTLSSPIDINVTSLSNNVVCQGNYLTFTYEISDTICNGQYLIELSDPNGNFGNPIALWSSSMFYPNTSSTLVIQIPNFAPPSLCYKLRVNRVSPAPQITGIASACFEIAVCPNIITTGPTPPVVTMDTADVCVGSVIDIPFFATGVYLTGNIFTAYLSDSSGNFSNPTVIGQLPSNQTFDPNIAPGLPGSVSGIIPNVPPGCNYYIKVRSVNPIANDTSTWGPFCIRNCDIETNGKQDLQFCISATDGDSALIPIDINIAPSNSTYNPGNQFQVELLDNMGFSRVNLGGLGNISATNDTLLWVVIPNFITLSSMGIQPGKYYMRVVATNSNNPNNQLGTVIRLTIGHPADNPLNIYATDSVVCQGGIATLWVGPIQMGSEYLWHLNNQVWPAISTGFNPANAIGVVFNGNAGYYNFNVQETNFGCTGPMSPTFTITHIDPPSISIIPNNGSVCFGDTMTYFVQFSPNTYYSWTPPTGGTMLDTSNNQMTVAWNQTTGQSMLNVYALNKCGDDTTSTTVYIKPSPNAFAGNDTSICEGDSIMLNATGGNNYHWNPTNTLQNPNSSSPIAFPTSTTNYQVRVTDNQNCKSSDTILITVNKKPIFDAGPDKTIVCGDSVMLNSTYIDSSTYHWTPTYNISNTTISNPFVSPIKSTTYQVEVTPQNGCKTMDSVMINVNDIFVDAGIDQNIICGDNIKLNATFISNVNYSWIPVYNISDNSIFNPVVSPIQTTTYTVLINNTIGCQAKDSITINVNEMLVDAGQDTTICKDLNVVLGGYPTAINSSLFSWQKIINGYLSYPFSYTANPVVLPVKNTQYVITVSNTLGCINSDTINIDVVTLPNTDTTFKLCNNFSMELTTLYTDATYLWNTGETTQNINITNFGLYTVQILTQEGCLITDSFSIILDNALDCGYMFYPPTTFRPGSNNPLNNVFIPITYGIDNLHLSIFNRWGEKLFESNNFTPWDGTYKEKLLPAGIYIWKAIYDGIGPFGKEEKSETGTIQLIR